MPLSWIQQVVRQWLAKNHAEQIRKNQANIRVLTKKDPITNNDF